MEVGLCVKDIIVYYIKQFFVNIYINVYYKLLYEMCNWD